MERGKWIVENGGWRMEGRRKKGNKGRSGKVEHRECSMLMSVGGTERPPRTVWVLAGAFCMFIAATGRLGLAGVGAVSLAYLWWRLRQ